MLPRTNLILIPSTCKTLRTTNWTWRDLLVPLPTLRFACLVVICINARHVYDPLLTKLIRQQETLQPHSWSQAQHGKTRLRVRLDWYRQWARESMAWPIPENELANLWLTARYTESSFIISLLIVHARTVVFGWLPVRETPWLSGWRKKVMQAWFRGASSRHQANLPIFPHG